MGSIMLVVGVAALLATSNASPMINTSRMLEVYDQSNDHDKKVVELSLSSMEEGIFVTNMAFASKRNVQQLYCQPDRLVLTGPQLVQMMKDEISKRPDLADDPTDFVILATLVDVFPCQTGRSQ